MHAGRDQLRGHRSIPMPVHIDMSALLLLIANMSNENSDEPCDNNNHAETQFGGLFNSATSARIIAS